MYVHVMSVWSKDLHWRCCTETTKTWRVSSLCLIFISEGSAVPGWAKPGGTAPLWFWRNNLLAIIHQANGRSHVGKWRPSEEPYLIIQFRSPVVCSTALFFQSSRVQPHTLCCWWKYGWDVSRLESMLSLCGSSFLKRLLSLIREKNNLCVFVCVM